MKSFKIYIIPHPNIKMSTFILNSLDYDSILSSTHFKTSPPYVEISTFMTK